MKSLKLLALFVITSLSLNAQIELEKSFSATATNDNKFSYTAGQVYLNSYSSKVVKHYVFDTRDSTLKFYNLDYSLYKTVRTITSPKGYKYFTICLVSTGLFNNDDNVEYIITYNKTVNNNSVYSMIIYDENGTVIKELGNYYVATALLNNNNELKLFTYSYPIYYTKYPTEYESRYKYDIYSLGGTVTSGVKSLRTSDAEKAYPNPSNSVVNLTYKLENNAPPTIMKIYNLNGQLIDQKMIDSTFDRILLNVETYQPGLYIYEYNGISNKFMVQ